MNNINRTQGLKLFGNAPNSKTDSQRRLIEAVYSAGTPTQETKFKLATLVKFVSIATRMQHATAKYSITMEKVIAQLQELLPTLKHGYSHQQMAQDLIYISVIKSPKAAGLKEFFRHPVARTHTMSQHAKGFIENDLQLNLSDVPVKSKHIDQLLNGDLDDETNPGLSDLNELAKAFKIESNFQQDDRLSYRQEDSFTQKNGSFIEGGSNDEINSTTTTKQNTMHNETFSSQHHLQPSTNINNKQRESQNPTNYKYEQKSQRLYKQYVQQIRLQQKKAEEKLVKEMWEHIIPEEQAEEQE